MELYLRRTNFRTVQGIVNDIFPNLIGKEMLDDEHVVFQILSGDKTVVTIFDHGKTMIVISSLTRDVELVEEVAVKLRALGK